MKYTYRLAVLFSVVFLCISSAPKLRATEKENDTLRHIFSFWHPEYWYTEQAFNFTDVLSSPTGDTVLQASVVRVNETFFDMDTLYIRVRMWETVKGTFLYGASYLCIQPTNDQKPLIKLFLSKGRPMLAYTPRPSELHFVDILLDSALLKVNFNLQVQAVDVSPNGRYALINSGLHDFCIYNLESGQKLMSDVSSYRGPLPQDQFITDQPIGVRPDSWCIDNSAVLLKFNQATVFHANQTGDSYAQLFRVYRFDSSKYAPGFFYPDNDGKWNNAAKKFVSYNSFKFYMTDLNHKIDSSSVSLDFAVSDYFWVQGTDRLVMIAYQDTISIRDLVTKQVYSQFNPGTVIGVAVNEDASLLAYMTSDNVLTVMNTKTLQGVFALKITINHDVIKGDEASLGFLHGDRVMYVRDKSGNLNFLDLPARKFIANLPPDREWFISDFGNSLFVRDTTYSRFDCFTGERLSRFPSGESLQRIISFSLSPNGDRIVCADSMGLHLWDIKTQTELARNPLQMIQECYWPADSSTIVVGHTDTTKLYHSYRVLNASNLQALLTLDSSQSLNYLGYSPDAQSIYFGQDNTLIRYSVSSKTIDTRWDLPAHPTALGWRRNLDSVMVGTDKGETFVLNLKTKTYKKYLDGFAPIARLKYNRAESALNLTTTDSVVVLRLSDMKVMGRLSKLTVDDFFLGVDSTSVHLYNGSIIEFRLSDGYIRQTDTRVTPSFRPTHDYYVTIGFKPQDSLKLSRLDAFKDQRFLAKTASRQPAVWSANGAAVAALDLYNNLIIWRPANMRKPDSTVNDIESDMIVDADVAPNPTRDGVYLRNLESATPVHVQVLNELGQPCLSTTMSAGEQWLDLRALQSGMYIVSVQTSQALVRAKVMLLR